MVNVQSKVHASSLGLANQCRWKPFYHVITDCYDDVDRHKVLFQDGQYASALVILNYGFVTFNFVDDIAWPQCRLRCLLFQVRVAGALSHADHQSYSQVRRALSAGYWAHRTAFVTPVRPPGRGKCSRSDLPALRERRGGAFRCGCVCRGRRFGRYRG